MASKGNGLFTRAVPYLLFVALTWTSVASAAGGRTFRQEGADDAHPVLQHQDAGDLLELGKPIGRDLAAGQTHFYQVPLEIGQYARVIIDQRGIDVLVRLYAPEGSLLTSVDGSDPRGPERMHIVADVAGTYRVSVTTFEKITAPGRYEASLRERRAAEPIDRERWAARRIFDEGEKLSAEKTPAAFAKAAEKYGDALSRYRAIGERHEEFIAAFGLGIASLESGNLKQALHAFDQGLSLAQALDDKYSQARMVEYTASIYSIRGEMDKAIQFQTQAAHLFQAIGDKIKEAHMADGLGGMLNRLGEHQRARDHFERALELYRALGYRNDEAAILKAIATSYSLQYDDQNALIYYRKALDMYRSTANLGGQASTLASIGDAYAKAGARREALDHIEQVMKLGQASPGGVLAPGLMVSVGVIHFRLGEFDKALSFYEAPLRNAQTLGNKRSEAVILKRIAEALRGKGKFSEAETAIEKSVEITEFMRDNAGSPEARSALVANLFAIYETYIDLKMRMHEAAPAVGHDIAAFNFVEKTQVRNLVELMTRARADLSHGVDAALFEREKAINKSITGKLDELTQLTRTRFTDRQRTTLDREVDALRVQLRDVHTAIRTSSPNAEPLAAPQPLSVADIQRRILDNDTMLLEYKLIDEGSYLWAVTRDEVRSFRLPPKPEIEAQVRRVYELLTARGLAGNKPSGARDAEYWVEANKLSSLLIGPVADQIGKKRLAIVADGALHYMPFAALPRPSGGTSSSTRPLAVDHEIVNLPSASVLEVLRRDSQNRPSAPRMAAVLADPVYDFNDARVRRPVAGVRGGAKPSPFQRLLFSAEEAETILSVSGTQSNLKALNFQSTRALAMSDELAKYRIIHFSTHGVLDSRRPELSGLVLSQVNQKGEAQDGFLRLHEIYNLRLNADLVVLSACQTALGSEVRGEGLVGLTRGFMHAGAPRVVASLWQVDDAATAALMKRFYRGMLERKLPPAAALREAQLDMLKTKAWSSPYYWGAFVLQGEWR